MPAGEVRRLRRHFLYRLWRRKPYNRHLDKPLWGLRVDGLSGRRFLRDLSLTRFWREGCCRAPLIYRRRPLMKKPLQLHLLKRVPPACKGGGEDHEVARGAADWRSGPQWTILSVLCPVHPFPLRGTSPRWEACHWIRGSRGSPMNPVPLPPQGETRYMKRKTGESYASCTTPAFPPLVAGATTLPGGKHVTGFAGRGAPL